MAKYHNRAQAVAALVRDTEVHKDCYIDDEVFERLKARNLALCVSDSEKLSAPVVVYGVWKLKASVPEDEVRVPSFWTEKFVLARPACTVKFPLVTSSVVPVSMCRLLSVAMDLILDTAPEPKRTSVASTETRLVPDQSGESI